MADEPIDETRSGGSVLYDKAVELSANELPEAFFSRPTPFGRRQREGTIRGRGGKRGWGVRTIHNNRAGHRLYVKVNQTRERRRNLVGFGRWRRWPPRWKRDGESWASLSAVEPMEPRPVRRAMALLEYRERRLGACRRIRCSCGAHGQGPKVPKWNRKGRRMVR